MASLAFPHATDPYPNLSQVVQLPERRVAADAGSRDAAAPDADRGEDSRAAERAMPSGRSGNR